MSHGRFCARLEDVRGGGGLDPERVSPHVLRPCLRVSSARPRRGFEDGQQLLGHADISTTEIYTHVLEERLKKIVF